MVKVTKQFKWAPDGIHVRDVKVGEVLDGRGAVVALQMGCGETLEDGPPNGAPPPQPPPEVVEEKSKDAPENKAREKAPKNKGR